jgi:hypothetical protein
MLPLAELRKAGFTKSGAFCGVDRTVNLRGTFPHEPGIYLFVIGRKVRYVGKTERSLRSRLLAYEKGLRKDLPRRPVHTAILNTIAEDKDVEIYTLSVSGRTQFFRRKGLPVDYLIGLESGLIENLEKGDLHPFNTAVRAKRAKLRGNS